MPVIQIVYFQVPDEDSTEDLREFLDELTECTDGDVRYFIDPECNEGSLDDVLKELKNG